MELAEYKATKEQPNKITPTNTFTDQAGKISVLQTNNTVAIAKNTAADSVG